MGYAGAQVGATLNAVSQLQKNLTMLAQLFSDDGFALTTATAGLTPAQFQGAAAETFKAEVAGYYSATSTSGATPLTDTAQACSTFYAAVTAASDTFDTQAPGGSNQIVDYIFTDLAPFTEAGLFTQPDGAIAAAVQQAYMALAYPPAGPPRAVHEIDMFDQLKQDALARLTAWGDALALAYTVWKKTLVGIQFPAPSVQGMTADATLETALISDFNAIGAFAGIVSLPASQMQVVNTLYDKWKTYDLGLTFDHVEWLVAQGYSQAEIDGLLAHWNEWRDVSHLGYMIDDAQTNGGAGPGARYVIGVMMLIYNHAGDIRAGKYGKQPQNILANSKDFNDLPWWAKTLIIWRIIATIGVPGEGYVDRHPHAPGDRGYNAPIKSPVKDTKDPQAGDGGGNGDGEPKPLTPEEQRALENGDLKLVRRENGELWLEPNANRQQRRDEDLGNGRQVPEENGIPVKEPDLGGGNPPPQQGDGGATTPQPEPPLQPEPDQGTAFSEPEWVKKLFGPGVVTPEPKDSGIIGGGSPLPGPLGPGVTDGGIQWPWPEPGKPGIIGGGSPLPGPQGPGVIGGGYPMPGLDGPPIGGGGFPQPGLSEPQLFAGQQIILTPLHPTDQPLIWTLRPWTP